jgi:hypothetical protein
MTMATSRDGRSLPGRRDVLAAGAVGALGLGLAGRRAEALVHDPAPPGFGRARSCILVYLLGGPSHLDMWDLKPDAPAEVRGPFRPIATSQPGLFIGEHLPKLAQIAGRYSLVRSVSHPNSNHTHMIYYTLTGRHMTSPNPNDNVPNPPTRADHPHLGSVVARFRGGRGGLPGYVALPELTIRMQPVALQGGNAGFLGPRFDPLAINDDPRNPESLRAVVLPREVTADRFGRREALLAAIDGRGPHAPPALSYSAAREAAAKLIGVPKASTVFFVDQEPTRVRDRYGHHRFGQSLLLARRLAEAGVPLIAVHYNNMSKCDGWDTHAKNFDCLKDELLPMLDQGLSALLEDLGARGRLEETLVVCMGEFGRTPRINPQAGRDHWGPCASVLLAGGGIQPGRVLGSSDRLATYPSTFPVDPSDIQATVYHALGLRPDLVMTDPAGRPLPISQGTPVRELLA